MIVSRRLRQLVVMLFITIGLASFTSPVRAQGYGSGYGDGYGNPSPTSTPGQGPTKASATWVKKVHNAALGTILVDGNGMTLYYFKNDSAGRPTCTGSCAQLWPPLVARGSLHKPHVSGTFKTVIAGGAKQVTYNGWPLYHYSGDKKAGDTLGQGLFKKWYAATPGLKKIKGHRR